MPFIQITADTTQLTADMTHVVTFYGWAVNSPVTADMTHFGYAVVSPTVGAAGSRADISPFSNFLYENETAWSDFLLVNALAHENYNTALELLGVSPVNYPIFDKGDTKEATDDWLHTHGLMHKSLTSSLGLTEVPDLTDVEVHDDKQFYDWLQLHMEQHQLLDAALNV